MRQTRHRRVQWKNGTRARNMRVNRYNARRVPNGRSHTPFEEWRGVRMHARSHSVVVVVAWPTVARR